MESQTISLVDWPSAPLTESLVRKSLNNALPLATLVATIPETFAASRDNRILQWATYDSMDHELTHFHDDSVLSSSYTIRKALIRKHFLSRCIHSYTTKHSESLLIKSTPRTWDLEIAYADELDEMWSDELWDLGAELEEDPLKWWIIKPGMADRGMGIRLFNSKVTLQKIFEDFEETSDDGEDDEDQTAVITSQLRHFVIQEYLSTPLLIDPCEVNLNPDLPAKAPETLQGYKKSQFHMRAYFVASGALKLYMYPRVLALFSAVRYSPPTQDIASDGQPAKVDLAPHLTNTSLQTHRGEDGVRLLDELIGCHVLSGAQDDNHSGPILTAEDISNLQDQMASVLAETFKAALENPVHFQPVPNAFELFGVDFLVSHNPVKLTAPERPYQVQLLEINSEPAIELTGPRLTWILEDLFLAIGEVCVAPFFAAERSCAATTLLHGDLLKKCLEVDVHGSGARMRPS